jgi:hypothetical protein
MATVIPSRYIKIEFTPEETAQIKVLPELWRLYLIHLRTEYSEQRLNLQFDPDKPQDFIHDGTFLSGKIDAISFLIGD